MNRLPPPPTANGRLELTYLYGGVAQYRAGETLGPRVLNDYELVLILEGQVAYRVDRHEYLFIAG
jgi:hypothetical protein